MDGNVVKRILRPRHSQSVFAVHQERPGKAPDLQSWGILEERQATACGRGRDQDAAFHSAWVWSFPWWDSRTRKVSEGCQVKNLKVGPKDCSSEKPFSIDVTLRIPFPK